MQEEIEELEHENRLHSQQVLHIASFHAIWAGHPVIYSSSDIEVEVTWMFWADSDNTSYWMGPNE